MMVGGAPWESVIPEKVDELKAKDGSISGLSKSKRDLDLF